MDIFAILCYSYEGAASASEQFNYRRCLYALQDNREMSEILIRSRRCKSGVLFERTYGLCHWETGKAEENEEA